MISKPLTFGNEQFLLALIKDPERNATRAYQAAYPNSATRSAAVAGNKLMRDERVQARLAVIEKELRERALLTAADVAQILTDLAQADPRDLVEYRRGACRYCHGAGHLYQRTPREYREAFALYQSTADGRADPSGLRFDYQGGLGFNINNDPHPDCPECFGLGEGYSHIKDVRTVPARAARAFAGVKQTKDGVQLLVRNQDKALEMAAKTLGMMRDRDDDEDNLSIPPAATVTYRAKDASKPAA